MLEVFDKNSKGLDLVENQGEAGGEVPEGGDSLFPQGSFQATAFKKHFHVSILMEYCSGNVALKHWLGGT